MKSQNHSLKYLKITIIILFVISVILIAIYPAKNQAITLVVDSTEGEYKVTYTVDEINGFGDFEMSAPKIGDANIKEIRLYRYFKTICVEKITSDSLQNYAQIEDDAILFNENAAILLKKLAHSLLCLLYTSPSPRDCS